MRYNTEGIELNMGNQNFRVFYNQNIQQVRENQQAEIDERKSFLETYPLSRIRKLSVDEYCLGTEKSKDSLCYLMEFGKLGFGIGGGSSRKHGVYYSKKDKCYMHGTEPIADIDKFWPQFRNELYQFLVLSGESETSLVLEDYPLLQGMAMVLTKYLSLYFPQKYLAIGSTAVLRNLMNDFGYTYDGSMRCHQLNYSLVAHIKSDYPELANEDGAILGKLAWEYGGILLECG